MLPSAGVTDSLRPLARRLRLLVVLLFLASSLIPFDHVSADLGPKPTLELIFDFSQLDAPIRFEEVLLYRCGADPACAEREPLAGHPGERMECDSLGCTATLMTGGQYWQLEAMSSDGVRTSAPFEKIGYFSVYRVVVLEDSLQVEFESSRERTGPLTAIVLPIALALAVTEAIELLVALVYLWIAREPKVTLIPVALVNLVTLPTVWLLVPILNNLGQWVVNAVETIAVIMFEAIAILIMRRGKMGARRAFTLSALMNLASFIVGLVLLNSL